MIAQLKYGCVKDLMKPVYLKLIRQLNKILKNIEILVLFGQSMIMMIMLDVSAMQKISLDCFQFLIMEKL